MRIGVVLAGGLSARMGRDKAALSWQGSSFLEHAKHRLLAAGCDLVLVSGDGYDIADMVRGAGPVPAVHGVLKALAQKHEGSQVLFLPVDLPLLQAALLVRLWLPLNGDANETAIAARYFAGHPLPLCLHNRAELRASMAATIASGERSMHGLLRRLSAQALTLTDHDAGQLFNTNAPEQYAQALSLAEAGTRVSAALEGKSS